MVAAVALAVRVDHGHIAMQSMAFVVLVAPEAVGVIVTLRFPLFRSI